MRNEPLRSLSYYTLLLGYVLLSGCVLLEPQDGPPLEPIDLETVTDIVPRYEAKSPNGNPDAYQVFGQTYLVLPESQGFIQRGTASWYGSKFHGNPTSNGEIYDMLAISAAHKTLPLPTYLQVTNLENGRRLVVRVNDRGPFHPERIIDLSYAAAYKLGFADSGTAKVEIRALNIPDPTSDPTTTAAPPPPPSVPPPTVVITPIQSAPIPAVATPLPIEEVILPGATVQPNPSPTTPAPPTAVEVATTTIKAPPTKPATATTASIYLQLGAFAQQANASALRNRLQQQGLGEVQQDQITQAGKPLHRLRLGPFAEPAEAQRRLQQALTLGVNGAHLLTLTP